MQALIRYAFSDRDTMNILRKSLKEKGIDVYTAEHHLHLRKPLSTKIQNAIEGSDVVVAFLLRTSAEG